MRDTSAKNVKLGVFLALVPCVLWGILPIGLKLVLETIDPYTVTWYRFISAFIVLGIVLVYKKRIRQLSKLDGKGRFELVFAAIFLGANFVLYIVGLHYTTPSNSQVVIQLGPMISLLGGVFLFGEPYAPRQWVGFCLLLGGLGLFFESQIHALLNHWQQYVWGTLLVAMAAVVWAFYSLLQKKLMRILTSEVILWVIYGISALGLSYFAKPGLVAELNTTQIIALIFCCANTLVAYGAFGLALDHLEISKVSAIVAVNPLIAVLSSCIAMRIWPGKIVEYSLGWEEWAGATLVVVGTVLASWKGKKRTRQIA